MKLNIRLTGFGSILSAPAYEFRIGFLAFALANKKNKQQKNGRTHSICLWTVAFTPFSNWK